MNAQIDKKTALTHFELTSYRNILISRFDTFGDIVLLQGFIQALLDSVPHAQVTLLVRQGYEQLSHLFPEKLSWIPISIHPFKDEPSKTNVTYLLNEFQNNGDDCYDLLLMTSYNRTWIDDLLAVQYSSAIRIAVGQDHEMSNDLQQSLQILNQTFSRCPYDKIVAVEEKSHETVKYQMLWEALTNLTSSLPQPQLTIPSDIAADAKNILTTLELSEGNFIFCCPAGIANVQIKQWPAERFAAVLVELEKRYQLRALVSGHESERKIVEEVITLAERQGASPVGWFGKDGQLSLTAALAQKATCYLGNDTGMIHIAAALSIPVIGIFGGGHWPRFTPCAKQGRVFVSPLPCFYCDWDCLFAETFCINSLQSDSILQYISSFIDELSLGKGDYQNIKLEITKEQLLTLFGSVSNSLEFSNADRIARLQVIQQQQAQLQTITRQLEAVSADSEARLQVIQQQQEQLQTQQEQLQTQQEQLQMQQEQLQMQQEQLQTLMQQLHNIQQRLLYKIGRKCKLFED